MVGKEVLIAGGEATGLEELSAASVDDGGDEAEVVIMFPLSEDGFHIVESAVNDGVVSWRAGGEGGID